MYATERLPTNMEQLSSSNAAATARNLIDAIYAVTNRPAPASGYNLNALKLKYAYNNASVATRRSVPDLQAQHKEVAIRAAVQYILPLLHGAADDGTILADSAAVLPQHREGETLPVVRKDWQGLFNLLAQRVDSVQAELSKIAEQSKLLLAAIGQNCLSLRLQVQAAPQPAPAAPAASTSAQPADAPAAVSEAAQPAAAATAAASRPAPTPRSPGQHSRPRGAGRRRQREAAACGAAPTSGSPTAGAAAGSPASRAGRPRRRPRGGAQPQPPAPAPTSAEDAPPSPPAAQPPRTQRGRRAPSRHANMVAAPAPSVDDVVSGARSGASAAAVHQDARAVSREQAQVAQNAAEDDIEAAIAAHDQQVQQYEQALMQGLQRHAGQGDRVVQLLERIDHSLQFIVQHITGTSAQ